MQDTDSATAPTSAPQAPPRWAVEIERFFLGLAALLAVFAADPIADTLQRLWS